MVFKLLLYQIAFFFFQAEDGIRDGHVTGVQTCALPISSLQDGYEEVEQGTNQIRTTGETFAGINTAIIDKIGRASCRERVEISVGGGSLKKRKGKRSTGGGLSKTSVMNTNRSRRFNTSY